MAGVVIDVAACMVVGVRDDVVGIMGVAVVGSRLRVGLRCCQCPLSLTTTTTIDDDGLLATTVIVAEEVVVVVVVVVVEREVEAVQPLP